MKKILIFIIIISTMLTISGCGFIQKENSKLKITTTIFPYYSFVKEICGDKADIQMLIKPGSESHTYDPTTQEILKIQNSDIFIYTGGESDAWVETALKSIDTSNLKIIKAIDFVEPVNSKHHEHSHNNLYDEHIWTSLKNAILITEKISDVICGINTENTEFYKENTSTFIKKLSDLDKEFKTSIDSTDKTVIFADRFPFTYFAKDYNLNYISAFPSCSEESEPSVQTISQIINTIKNENISSIFYIEFSNQKIADTVIKETGTNKLLFHSCHNITKEDFEAGVSYLSLMQQNLTNLKEAIE